MDMKSYWASLTVGRWTRRKKSKSFAVQPTKSEAQHNFHSFGSREHDGEIKITLILRWKIISRKVLYQCLPSRVPRELRAGELWILFQSTDPRAKWFPWCPRSIWLSEWVEVAFSDVALLTRETKVMRGRRDSPDVAIRVEHEVLRL
jgi:hypothetical protein